MSNRKVPIFSNLIEFIMARMYQPSSGRRNFDFVKSDDKNDSLFSQQQQTSDNQTNLVEQQTREAIKAAGKTQHEKNKNSCCCL